MNLRRLHVDIVNIEELCMCVAVEGKISDIFMKHPNYDHFIGFTCNLFLAFFPAALQIPADN